MAALMCWRIIFGAHGLRSDLNAVDPAPFREWRPPGFFANRTSFAYSAPVLLYPTKEQLPTRSVEIPIWDNLRG